MRLLYIKEDGGLGWTEDLLDAQVPPYAILSHTWGEQEVTYKDLQNCEGTGLFAEQLKEGSRKIEFCAEQAKRDGLSHFWIDTSCIDKSNSQELQEAINSMFRWYQRAERCYVYLSDVKHSVLDAEGESAFKGSRWFTRGWTLQELLAPKSVEFFSSAGVRLGDKESLIRIVHELTKIPIQALSGGALSNFSVDDRFSWAEKRSTTREEDNSYCLLGIFGIYLPLIYGEGKENALYRLRQAVIAKHDGWKQEEELARIFKWLLAPDPSTNYRKAQKIRQADTGQWLLRNPRFSEWKTSSASCLWLYGIAGSGKTILSSTVVENLLQHCRDDSTKATIYFYFDFRDARKQDPELMLRSLLHQLLQLSLATPESVDSLFLSCGNGKQQPSQDSLLQVMSDVMQRFTQVYVVLDALDECTQRQELLDTLEAVAGWQLGNVHLLMTSRKERDIECSLRSYVKEQDSICLQSHTVDEDIQRYVRRRLIQDKSLAKWNKDAAIKREIEITLMQGARGMFRWAVCQLDALTKCRNRAMLRKSLATLPQTLDQTYERILTAISDEDREYAMRIFQWLTFSVRPLTAKEIAEIVAIDVTRDPAFNRDEVLEDPLEALNICSSLIMTQGAKNPYIVLAHYSVKEYLVSDRIRQGPAKQYSMPKTECHNAITNGSLMYLLQLQEKLSAEALESFALAEYAAIYWHSHFEAGGKKEGRSLVVSLLSMGNPAYRNWVQLADPYNFYAHDDPKIVAPSLCYTAGLGFSTATRLLLDNGADVNLHGRWKSTALTAACAEGRVEIINMLLDEGADVNAPNKLYGTALRLAVRSERDHIVELLLNRGANPNAPFCHFRSIVLQEAASTNLGRIVKLLLDNGADLDATSNCRFYGTALQQASAQGHEEIVRILLHHGADVSAGGKFKTFSTSSVDRHIDGEYSSALHAASANGHDQIVKMLLDAGAQGHQEDGHVLALE